jgi:mannose-6-phosphate isomerase-like protein (cupin superfamily)
MGHKYQPIPHKGEIHEKAWGHELWIVNHELYCGKLLVFEKGKKFSMHYHLIKDEVFYIHSGKIRLLYGLNDNKNEATELILNPGDHFHVPPRMRHQMLAIQETDLYEFSTQHFEEDSIRVEKGD